MANLFESVQFEIGDSVEENGIMPGNIPVTEKQFQYACSAEHVTEQATPSQREIGRVSAKLLEMASVAWASKPLETELGPATEVNNSSIMLSRKASKLRAIWGYGDEERGDEIKSRPAATYAAVGMYPSLPGIN